MYQKSYTKGNLSMIIKNGTIYDAIHETPYSSDIRITEDKITEIGPNLDVSCDEEVIDASGLQIYPGFVDAHSHIGTDGYGIGYEGNDYNEMNDILSPQLRGIDGINPMDETFVFAREAGVTSVATGSGSANVLGGTFVAIKTFGTRVDDMVIKDPIAMKCAFGENPKRVYRNSKDSCRMTTAALLRDLLFQAKEYQAKVMAAKDDITKRPAYNMKLEALLPVINKEIPLKAHAHQANDIFTAIRIAKELDINLTIEHTTEGHLIAQDLAKEGYPVAVGPSFGHATKFELRNKTFKTPGILSDAGLDVSIITDAPVIPQHYLPICAGLAVKSGMDPFKALQAITINPAKHIGISDRVGSLEVGKDADIVIANGSPFEISTEILSVFILGKRVKG